MSCRNCKHCQKKAVKKEKELPKEKQIEIARKNATYNFAIAALWKKMAKQWDLKATELARK